MSVFPSLPGVRVGSSDLKATKEWLFSHFAPPALDQPAPVNVTLSQEKPAGPNATTLTGTNESTWNDAAVYKLDIPASAAGRRITLDVHYIGDAARLYVGDKLIDDDFFNGDPFAIALWRIPATDWADIRLKVLPYSEGLAARLPERARKEVGDAKAASTLDQVTVTASDQLEIPITAQ
jgi:hypothetical protein